jgi:hypothetical protein
MSDIKELLQESVRSIGAPSDRVVEADVRRGKAALDRSRRRRVIRSSVVSAAAATLVVAGVVASLGTNDRELPRAPTGVQLVAYSGDQLDGFIVDRAPEGWFLQGSSPFALTIAPDGDTTHPDNFIGKLVVMLFSQDVKQELPDGEPVEVNGNDGVIVRLEDVTRLFFEDGEGHFVEIQSPAVLGWSNDQLARFAEGVQVTADAQQGRG